MKKYLFGLVIGFFGFYPLLGAGQTGPETCDHYRRRPPVTESWRVNPSDVLTIPIKPGPNEAFWAILTAEGEPQPYDYFICGANSSFGKCVEPAFVKKNKQAPRENTNGRTFLKYYFNKFEPEFDLCVRNLGTDRLFISVHYFYLYCAPLNNGK